jgi:hypothetical protein
MAAYEQTQLAMSLEKFYCKTLCDRIFHNTLEVRHQNILFSLDLDQRAVGCCNKLF